MTDKDQIYAQAQKPVERFVFDATVADVFPDMIERSVPGYAAILHILQVLAQVYAQPKSCLYDLGCSLGATSLAMVKGLPIDHACKIIAVDNAPAMLAQAQKNVQQAYPIQFKLADIRQIKIEAASIVALNFTLQFIPIADRLPLLKAIRAGLQPGGILFLSEKILGATPEQNAAWIAMHHAFKRMHGYSELEISQKRTALEKVLLPETLETHQQRLAEAGFVRSDVCFQYFNFVAIVAYT